MCIYIELECFPPGPPTRGWGGRGKKRKKGIRNDASNVIL
jgi:hypothetical protein